MRPTILSISLFSGIMICPAEAAPTAASRDALQQIEAPQSPRQDPGVDAQVVKRWQDAGALFGWLVQADYGTWHYLVDKPEGVNSLPVFVLREYKPGMFNGLPEPKVSFAIGAGQTTIDDQALIDLAKFGNLRSIDLSHSKVTDKGLKQLVALTGLNSVDLGASSLSDKGAKQLAKVPQLQHLYLGSTAVTDKGIKQLAKLDNLVSLYLYNTEVTDRGLMDLAKADTLRILILTETRVSARGITDFAAVAPEVGIMR